MSKRRIERINTQNTNDYSAQLIGNTGQYSYKIIDYNSISMKIKPIKEKINESDSIFSLNIIYINRIIASIYNPSIIRKLDDGVLIIDLCNSSKEKKSRTNKRMEIIEKFKPFLIVADPIQIDRTLHFELINITSNGFAIKSSLSNKHLIPGQTIRDAKMHLPIVGIVNLNFEVKRISMRDNHLIIGAAFIDTHESDLEKIAQFCLFGTAPEIKDSSSKAKLLTIKENIFNLRDLGRGISVEIVNNETDYSGVLEVRFNAYKKANKLSKNISSSKDFADTYDKHSIIIIAKIGSDVVGTVRMVFCDKNEQRFPFEEFLNEKNFLQNERANYFEVSRLAIDPSLQRSDILMKLFKEVARLTIVNRKTTLCFSTRILRPMYQKIGFTVISTETPHPTIERETLALMKIESDDFIYGSKMKKEIWEKFSKEVVQNLEYGGLLPVNTKAIVENRFKIKSS
jgi:hypothetical protein